MAVLVAVVAVAAFGVWAGGLVPGGDAGPSKVTWIVVPHPDDEAQAWSLIENTPAEYKVFLLLTRGESTSFCAPGLPGLDADAGEIPPEPEPERPGTDECGEARLNSFLGFLDDMAGSDPGLPSELRDRGTARGARVWTSEQGAVVAFDLDDRNLTEAEVVEAIETVRDHRDDFGIDRSLPDHRLIAASYWNDGSFPGCLEYPHDDHAAVSRALWTTGFGMGDQLGATCAGDERATVDRRVSAESWEAMFGIGADGRRLGAHVRHYGWLLIPYWAGATNGQDELFHQDQHFWTRSS